jgi:hypothetical protein
MGGDGFHQLTVSGAVRPPRDEVGWPRRGIDLDADFEWVTTGVGEAGRGGVGGSVISTPHEEVKDCPAMGGGDGSHGH